MALDINIIESAFAYIRANPSMSQEDQETYLANAFKSFVEGADVTYTTGTLTAPSGGGPVTVTSTSPIATLS